MLDIASIRADAPGVANVRHFNHAGGSLLSARTLKIITGQLEREAGFGAMESQPPAAEAVEVARATAARLLNADASEIAFTSSNSAAYGLALAALPPLQRGQRILVGRQEWGGNLSSFEAKAEAAGATVEQIPCLPDGSVDAGALKHMLDSRVALVALTWAPANGGLLNDAEAVGAALAGSGIPYFVDAAQAIGQIPADVHKIGCDVLTAAGRKYLRGPRGTGLLYVRQGFLDRLNPAYLDVISAPWNKGPQVRPDARRFETAERSLALLMGFGEALRQAEDYGIPAIRQRIQTLSEDLRTRLAGIEGVSIEDLGAIRTGIISFQIRGWQAVEAMQELARRQINVGANGLAYTPFDIGARGLPDLIRASVSYLNTEEELAELVANVHDMSRMR
ncbi:aminotransferase class V-fold PLP-dependent enzyme [Lacibacterium aquatile]|uniref:Aminotransferase class V-fold PLP-dependent enzyme n=1 Tax=Lacibacterium aquatile TaxID=1168082 RepID=A0ABW5DNA5_9PROT